MIAFAQAPSEPFPPAASVKQLMLDLIHPSSNDILLAIYRGGPKDDTEWAAVRRSAVTLAESGNMLMLRGRARDQGGLDEGREIAGGCRKRRVQSRAGQRRQRARGARRGPGRFLHDVSQAVPAERVSRRTEGRNELFA